MNRREKINKTYQTALAISPVCIGLTGETLISLGIAFCMAGAIAEGTGQPIPFAFAYAFLLQIAPECPILAEARASPSTVVAPTTAGVALARLTCQVTY